MTTQRRRGHWLRGFTVIGDARRRRRLLAQRAAALFDSTEPPGDAIPGLTLADLRPGECATVVLIEAGSALRLRLLEMGLTKGAHVRVIRAAALGGPLDIEIRGYQLSLRRSEAAAVRLGYPASLLES